MVKEEDIHGEEADIYGEEAENENINNDIIDQNDIIGSRHCELGDTDTVCAYIGDDASSKLIRTRSVVPT